MRVRRMLSRRGMTVSDLSRASGVPRSAIDKMLNHRGNLNADQWWRVWDSLGVSDGIVNSICEMLDKA